MAADDPKTEAKKMQPTDTIWVICVSPVTLLMDEPRTEQPTGAAPRTPAQVPLKLERGLNVLVGPMAREDGSTRWLTLDGLPSALQQLPVEERGHAARKLFEVARKRYAPQFQAVGNIPPRISAVGTMGQLVREHYAELIMGATNGTHRASLEALVNFPGDLVLPHLKDLARARLAAWRPAA